jgi:hypothetical protein
LHGSGTNRHQPDGTGTILMVLIIRAGAGHPPDGPAGHPPDGADGPDGSNQAKQKWDKRPDDQDGSGFIN